MPRTISQKLRDLADAMQKDIDAKLSPGIARQNLTPRRARIADGMRKDGHRLERIQCAMRNVATALDAGDTTHAALTTRKAFESLKTEELEQLAGGPRVPTPQEVIAKLEAGLIGTKIPGFFPTPAATVRTMLTYAQLAPGQRVLEPSAGKGDIAAAVLDSEPDCTLDTIEINHTLRGILTARGLVVLPESDFLAFRPTYRYDRILMNPPFEKLADIAHVRHAFDLLAPGGRLVAIMGEGSFVRNDARAEDFRTWLKSHEDDSRGEVMKLPAGSFTGAGAFRQTGANCRIVVLDAPMSQADHEADDPHCSCADCMDSFTARMEAPDSQPTPEVNDEVVPVSAAAAPQRRTRADVDWRSAGLKAWETRRQRAAAAAHGGASC